MREFSHRSDQGCVLHFVIQRMLIPEFICIKIGIIIPTDSDITWAFSKHGTQAAKELGMTDFFNFLKVLNRPGRQKVPAFTPRKSLEDAACWEKKPIRKHEIRFFHTDTAPLWDLRQQEFETQEVKQLRHGDPEPLLSALVKPDKNTIDQHERWGVYHSIKMVDQHQEYAIACFEVAIHQLQREIDRLKDARPALDCRQALNYSRIITLLMDRIRSKDYCRDVSEASHLSNDPVPRGREVVASNIRLHQKIVESRLSDLMEVKRALFEGLKKDRDCMVLNAQFLAVSALEYTWGFKSLDQISEAAEKICAKLGSSAFANMTKRLVDYPPTEFQLLSRNADMKQILMEHAGESLVPKEEDRNQDFSVGPITMIENEITDGDRSNVIQFEMVSAIRG